MRNSSRFLLPLVLCLVFGLWIAGFGARDEFLKAGDVQGGGANGLNYVKTQATEPPSKRGKYGGTLTIATLGEPKNFNLWATTDSGSIQAVGPLYDSLITQNSYTQQWQGALADLPEISKDGLTWTFHLKPGLKWSDGVPLTADDVIFTVDMIYDEKTQGLMREGMLVAVENKKTHKFEQVPLKYRKLDERSVEFVFPVPYAPARSMLNIAVAPRHKLYAAWKAGKINSTWSISTPVSELVGSGPWVMSSYVPGQRLTYARNKNYWRKDQWGGALPYFEKYVQVVTPDVNTMVLKFKNGETDTVSVPAPEYPDMKRDENGKKGAEYAVYDLGPSDSFSYLGFNLNPNAKVEKWKIDLFQQQKFRQAVSYAINRELMCVNLFRGLAIPAWSPESPANKLFFNPNVQKYPYNPEKAEQWLDEIGARDTDGDGVREWQGHPIQFAISTNVENNLRKKIGIVLTKDLKNIGLNPVFTPIAFNKLVGSLDSPPYQWEAIILSFGGGGTEPNNSANVWYSFAHQHQWHPEQKTPSTPWEAEIDDLFRRGATTLDQKGRKKIYDRYQEIAAEQMPFIYTITPDSIVAVRAGKFGNFKPNSNGGALWNSDELYDLSATKNTP